MVRPSGCREGDDFVPVKDRTGRVEGRTVTVSSRNARGRHSTSNLPTTPIHFTPSFHHGTGEPGSSAQPWPYLLDLDLPSNPISLTPLYPMSHMDLHNHHHTLQTQYMIHTYMLPLYDLVYYIDLPPKNPCWNLLMFGATPHDSSCSTHGYSHTEYGVSSSVPYVPSPVDRVCEGDISLKGDRGLERSKKESDPYILRERRMREDEGDEEQPMPVAPMAHASRSDERPHHGKGKGLTGSFMPVMRSWFIEVPIVLHGTNNYMLLPPVDRLHCCLVSGLHAIYNTSWVAHSSVIRVAILSQPDYGHSCGMRVLNLGQASRVDAKELARCWSLLEAWIYLYFPLFAPSVRQGTEACKPYIQQFPMLGYKNENKLMDIHLRLDVMTADEVRWVPYIKVVCRCLFICT
ncbi:hypothetical protein M9H77_09007 [Catharanthus roseus]|uniref:Uncharacterized protein n=1 Tax=Catharanthus roseus TaxID=4058 RepID=A0ACC0BZP6_CATRO|nr:hypothetical protein M9H77_09007 [Catharanthus roseus]